MAAPTSSFLIVDEKGRTFFVFVAIPEPTVTELGSGEITMAFSGPVAVRAQEIGVN